MLYRRKIEPSCSYCRHGITLGMEEVICRKRGIVSESSSCSAFYYEPTKRKPEYANITTSPKYSEGDFDIA